MFVSFALKLSDIMPANQGQKKEKNNPGAAASEERRMLIAGLLLKIVTSFFRLWRGNTRW